MLGAAVDFRRSPRPALQKQGSTSTDQPEAHAPCSGPAAVPAVHEDDPAHHPHPTVPVHDTHVISLAQSSGQMSKYH
jgi:hypothetical protein